MDTDSVSQTLCYMLFRISDYGQKSSNSVSLYLIQPCQTSLEINYQFSIHKPFIGHIWHS